VLEVLDGRGGAGAEALRQRIEEYPSPLARTHVGERAGVRAEGEGNQEPGPVEVKAGSSSSDIRSSAKFTVAGNTRVIKGEDRAFLTAATVGS
jgi:hypothetical protein